MRRNPFKSLQLFRAFQADDFLSDNVIRHLVAIPSTFQGISSRADLVSRYLEQEVAIPSTFQGISSTQEKQIRSHSRNKSQSLQLFRAFQALKKNKYEAIHETSRNPFNFSGHFKEQQLEISEKDVSRNPFNFSGHFKALKIKGEQFLCVSQSLQLFRAFQVLVNLNSVYNPVSQSLQLFRAFQDFPDVYTDPYTCVAIPSTFQGISSKSRISDKQAGDISRNPFNFSGHFKGTYS